jgi:hypothetical protein
LTGRVERPKVADFAGLPGRHGDRNAPRRRWVAVRHRPCLPLPVVALECLRTTTRHPHKAMGVDAFDSAAEQTSDASATQAISAIRDISDWTSSQPLTNRHGLIAARRLPMPAVLAQALPRTVWSESGVRVERLLATVRRCRRRSETACACLLAYPPPGVWPLRTGEFRTRLAQLRRLTQCKA